jgi:membrane protease YdiL (CAAX protease family)
MDATRRRRSGTEPQTFSAWSVTLLAVVLVSYGNAIAFPRLPEWVVLLSNLAVGLVLVRALGAFGHPLAEVGLSREAWRQGWKWGVLIGAGVMVAVAVLAGPAGLFPADPAVQGMAWGLLAWQVLIRIPIGTALFEETVFRGVLYGLSRRTLRWWQAATLSSVAFAFWHVVVELHRQERQGHTWGGDGLANTLPILGFLFVVGFVLCGLREKTAGVVAPTIVHWAANSSAAIGVYLVSN